MAEAAGAVRAASEPALRAGLAAALRVVARPAAAWALGMVLNQSPAGALAVLTDPHAAAAVIASSGVQTLLPPPLDAGAAAAGTVGAEGAAGGVAGGAAYRATCENIFVPAFSAGGLSVGVVANRAQLASAAAGGAAASATRLAVGRYARSDATGELLVVNTSAALSGGACVGGAAVDEPTVQISHIRVSDACHRVRSSYVLPARVWPAAAAAAAVAGRGDRAPLAALAAALAEAVVFSVRIEETRSCPDCGAPAATYCGCPTVGPPPRHAFDFASNRATFHKLLGRFVGRAERAVRLPTVCAPGDGDEDGGGGRRGGVAPSGMEASRPGLYVAGPALMSQVEARGALLGGDGDPGAGQMGALLREFAVQVSLAEQAPLAPLPAPAIGRVAPAQPVPAFATDEPAEARLCDVDDSDLCVAGETDLPLGLPEELLVAPTPKEPLGALEAELFDDMEAELFPPEEADCIASRLANEAAGFGFPVELGAAAGSAKLLAAAAAAETATATATLTATAKTAMAAAAPPGPCVPPPSLCDERLGEGDIVGDVLPLHDLAGAADAEAAVPRGPRRPRPSTETEMLRRKKERREKNRAAAARANARRKAHVDGLRPVIARERAKLNALRVRRAELAAANLELWLQLERANG